MDILQLIDELEDVIDDASSVPFTKKVSVNPEDIYEIINDLRDALPEEIKEAKWVNEEKERILTDAKTQADTLVNQAKGEVEKSYEAANRKYRDLVNENAITMEAKKQAAQIVQDAENTAHGITKNSLAYVDGMLVKTEEELKNLLKVIEENRSQLKY